MTNSWTAPGSHAVQFYKNEPFLHHAIAEFFTDGARTDDPLILISRPRTFKGVAEQLSSGRHGPAADVVGRILFADAEATLPQLMEGETLDPVRAERLFKEMLSQVRPADAHGSVRFYGEMVDLACQRGRHATALQLEGIADLLLGPTPHLSILCGYALERFKHDTNSAEFHAVCQKHTHVFPAESVHTVYVIDDDASLRRSLGRLLTSSNWPVRTFESAEAFLAELNGLSAGCIILDIQLQGVSGLELMERLADTGLSWPIVAMSASHDEKLESEALRLGARSFLRKPFNPQAMLHEISRAFVTLITG